MRIIILEVVQCSEEKALRSEVGEMGNQSTTFGKESEQSRCNVKYGIIVNKNRLLKNDPKPQIIEVANIREHGEKAAQKLDGLTADKSQTDQNISIMHGDRHVQNSESE